MMIQTEEQFHAAMAAAVACRDIEEVHAIRQEVEDWLEVDREKSTRRSMIDAVLELSTPVQKTDDV